MSSDITKLPKELLALIFEHLTKANDRRRAAQVCKLFYEIVRHQSTLKRDNMLRMKGSDSNKSPIRAFENSAFFPFSKLSIKDWHQNVVMESDFWSLHSEKIGEIIFDRKYAYNMESVLSTLREYFPNLKKLTIECNFLNYSDTDNSENISVPLPIEDLSIDICHISVDQTVALLRCSPLLKNVEIKRINADHLPQILPWLETIENSRLTFNEMPLEKLINLPSKVDIGQLTIKANEKLETIREFFKQPRTIDELILYRKNENEDFYGEDEDNPAVLYFTREQALALGAAKSIKKVHLYGGVLEFEGSLDFLARFPGVETISLNIYEGLSKPLHPFYWSTPETAQKIREVAQLNISKVYNLPGLSSVTSITILNSGGLFSDEIKTLIRNCPNLRKLSVPRMDASDSDLIGHGDHLPISSLEKLEYLNITYAPYITSEAFRSGLKFPNLKYFHLYYDDSSEEQPFNQDVAKHFTQNCPNLENLEIYSCPITDEGFDFLIRHLPYLRRIDIQQKKRNSLSKAKVEKIQKEFPYIEIISPY